MPSGVVVDTTLWIDFFRGRNEPARLRLRNLLRNQKVVVVGMVLAEVLQGIRSRAEQQQVEDYFTALPYFEATQKSWRTAAEMARKLRSEGQTLPLSDLLIAAIAIEHGLSVYSTDPHFSRIPDLTLYEANPDMGND